MTSPIAADSKKALEQCFLPDDVMSGRDCSDSGASSIMHGRMVIQNKWGVMDSQIL